MSTLRPYQQEAVDECFGYLGRAEGNPLIVLPTGSGKSLVLAAICREATRMRPECRILVATHRAELIKQDHAAIMGLWPQADAGMYSAGLGHRQIRQITVGGVQSLCKVDLPKVELVIIDECHLVPKEGTGQYQTLIASLRDKNPDLRIIGLTATPYRLSGGRLTRGKTKIFDSICYELPVERLVEEGYLSPLVTPASSPGRPYSTTGIGTSGGDFKPGELADSLEGQESVTRDALVNAAQTCISRESWLVYCVSREHARQAQAILFEIGIASHVVTGEDDMATRTAKIDSFKRGDVRVMISIDVLTTGFDAPVTDCIILLRPTQSTGLYVQICGRGMRLSPATGKKDCLVLDYGGNIERHGPITAVAPKESKEKPPAGDKICPKCDAEIKAHRRECPECGYIFPPLPREIAHERTYSAHKIMGPAPEPTWVPVLDVVLARWDKREGISSVVVKYITGNLASQDYREWICPEHGGFATKKFHRWWHERGGIQPWPATIDETLERQGELKRIEAIVVEKENGFDRVKQVRFAPEREPGSDDVSDEERQAMYVAIADADGCPF